MRLEGEEGMKERGARMSSIGLLSSTFIHLHKHIEFLKEAIRLYSTDEEQSKQLLTWYYENQSQKTTRKRDSLPLTLNISKYVYIYLNLHWIRRIIL
jgi:hypothetical protein